ncbi:STAS domain-containing protein [Azospirillum sp. RWY-5-1]|uniref:Anti-sigma factor antagonist n=1 Tax=Azospirillum oleiclasticum TaxID=2735135 RepID=A0ABX2TAE4_9PROT|nr:STAS domain-containing protein [Azospirillum oleiclasticum]NYZ15262.1 STAS domain-containing protein [Azospirillum oleiclasticum]NYZ21317.1 STAS domain-containing protein [Azospirillum oleiclasticum]
MDFESSTSSDGIEARLRGRLEFTDHDRLRDIVRLLESDGIKRMVIDLKDLEFIDSAGLGMLLIMQEEAEQRNVKLIVRGPRNDVKRSIDLARISEIITIET